MTGAILAHSGRLPGDPGQPQQPHRRAAHARAARVRASLCRDRDGRESPGRDRAPRRDRRTRTSVSSSTRARRTSKGSAGSTASRGRRASSSSRWAATAPRSINADDRYADLWRGLARGAGRHRSPSGCASRPISARRSPMSRLVQDRLRHRVRARMPLGNRDRSCSTLAGEHNVMNALAAAAAAHAAGAGLDDIERACSSVQRGLGTPAAEAGARRRAAHRRLLQRKSRLGARRPHVAGRRSPASTGWCSARWRSSAPQSARLHAEIGRVRARDGRRTPARGGTGDAACGGVLRPGGELVRERRRADRGRCDRSCTRT